MTINSDIRDQAYQFFVEEARELLQVLESGLLTLKQEHSVTKVHELMRAAHSIKGGAAGLGLESIKTISHRLEDIFNALYSQKIEIDTELESLLLVAYDCLRDPLLEQIEQGSFDSEKATATAESVFVQIEERLGDAIAESRNYVPDSTDLGVDVVASIFAVDVAQGLERLIEVAAYPQNYEVAGELRAQAEVFAGFAELLNLPGFGRIAQTALSALELHPERAVQIIDLTIADCQEARERVLAGDRTSGGSPSAALLDLSVSTEEESDESDFFEFSPFSENENSTNLENWGDNFQQGQEHWANIFDTTEDLMATDTVWREVSLTNFSPSHFDEVFSNTLDEQEITQLDYQETQLNSPSLDEVFGTLEDESIVFSAEAGLFNEMAIEEIEAEIETFPTVGSIYSTPENIEATVESIEKIFEHLPSIENIAELSPKPEFKVKDNPKTLSIVPVQPSSIQESKKGKLSQYQGKTKDKSIQKPIPNRQGKASSGSGLSVRVDLDRLERMNNLVGELAINRNSLSLQNEQVQGVVRELLNRFAQFKEMATRLQEISDQMVIAPETYIHKISANGGNNSGFRQTNPSQKLFNTYGEFDSLEMDNYSKINSVLQGLVEEIVQLEETVDDIVLFSRQSHQTIERQRQMHTYLRDELMWARMLPLGEILNRFPRVLRDLSTKYNKPVSLKITGTGVLVDKAVLEKLYDPLVHLLRNAFDHGIELPEIRYQQNKPEEGTIEISAYHQGNQTIIEVKDDGQGLNLEKIGRRAVELGFISEERLAITPKTRLLDFIFQPGLSTATEVSELSGRGVGLDAVRFQLQALKGSVSVASSPGKGTIFTLRLPLTLTISKLLVCLVSSTAIALPSDSIEEILIPKEDQIKKSGTQEFLNWRNQIIPIYRLSELLDYRCPLPDVPPSEALATVPTPEDWASPLLLLRQGQQIFAVEVNRIVTEQELVIKPFGGAIAPPTYIYGCTILGDGSLVPVINGNVLLSQYLGQVPETTAITTNSNLFIETEPEISLPAKTSTIHKTTQTFTILVVDDSAALRRTLALTLQKSGYRVLQARDGQEALEQLRQSSKVNLVICDIEMPNMNGFEFLSVRRQDQEMSKIPTAMLTSRSSDKHRQLAIQLGANAYFTKPYIEQEFLAALKGIINQNAVD